MQTQWIPTVETEAESKWMLSGEVASSTDTAPTFPRCECLSGFRLHRPQHQAGHHSAANETGLGPSRREPDGHHGEPVIVVRACSRLLARSASVAAASAGVGAVPPSERGCHHCPVPLTG